MIYFDLVKVGGLQKMSNVVLLAVSTALVVANSVFRAVEIIGYPECQLNLVHGVTYL